MNDLSTIIVAAVFGFVAVALLIYLLVEFVSERKLLKKHGENTIYIDGKLYKLVQITKDTPVEEVAPVKEEKVEETPVETVKKEETETLEENKNQIIVTKEETKTLREKYFLLSEDGKDAFDEIHNYLRTLDEVVTNETKYKNTYKFMATKLAQLEIRKDVVICKCFVFNEELQTYGKEEKVSTVKTAPVTFKLVDEKSINACKFTLEVIYKNIYEAKGPKKRK